jgi:hypothetical protein
LTFEASKDNSLYEDTLGGLSNGSGPTFFAGNTLGGVGSRTRRGLIEFDLSVIPSGSIIHSVVLDLYLVQAQSFPTDVGLHEVLAEWGEGTSSAGNRGGGGTAATANDATWLHTFFNGTFWAGAGGDFVAAASATSVIGGEGVSYEWTSTAALVADVQGWVDAPATNHGWLLRGDESQGGTAKAFATREDSNEARQPSLTVTFTPVPEPQTWLTLLGGLGLLLQMRPRHRARS